MPQVNEASWFFMALLSFFIFTMFFISMCYLNFIFFSYSKNLKIFSLKFDNLI